MAAATAAIVVAGVLPAVLTPATAAVPLPTAVVNDPPLVPHAITAFPARDFVSEDGLTPGDTVVFEVTHSEARGGGTFASTPVVVGDDGLAEVNHPGGACWLEVTPNIVAGDTVRVVVTQSPDSDGDGVGDRDGHADVTRVADVVASRPVSPGPGVVELHGTARTADGQQIPPDQIDARLVAPNRTFARSGRRDLRAPGQGTIAYDAPGSADSRWTARWSGLSQADVDLALGAEAMGNWLGRDPAAGTEGTIYETGAGIANGPQPPCTAPKERLAVLPGEDGDAPTVPAGVTATVSDSNVVTLVWAPATDAVGVTNYGVYRNGVPIFTVQNADASAPAPTTFVDRNVPPGSWTYTVDAADAVDNRSASSEPATATTSTVTAPTVAVGDPPTHPFVLFPSREMVDVEQVAANQTVHLQVLRDGTVVTDAPGLRPDATGLVEINHVGTNCWSGTTPELRAGDVVRATVTEPDGSTAWVEQARVANVTATTATDLGGGVVEAHGTAVGHDGAPLPVEQLEHRLVSATAQPFGKTGRRDVRADSTGLLAGVLAYDPVDPVANPDGTRWTARYSGLDAADVALATRVVSVASWLGRDPAAGLELTLYEAGGADAPGPAVPDCVGPLEPIDTQAPTAPQVTATPDPAAREVVLSWAPATDDAYVYGYLVRDGSRHVARLGGDTTRLVLRDVAPGPHRYTVTAIDSASARGAGAADAERLASGQGRPYGNLSPESDAAAVELADVQAPAVPQNLQVTNPTTVDPTTQVATSSRTARLVFDPSTDDSGAAPDYEVFRDGVLLPAAQPTMNTSGKVVYVDQQLTRGATYRYAVLAKDATGNRSARTPEVSVTIAPDVERPVFTGTPVVTVPDIHGREVRLVWQAATDDVGVTGYGVYRDGTRIAQLGAGERGFTEEGVAPGTHRYKVDAVDSAGNRSDRGLQAAEVAVIANDPPAAGHVVIAYPARDFVEGQGYTASDESGTVVGQTVDVQVFRRDAAGVFQLVGQARTTADGTGLVEVNHAGPGCWGTAAVAGTPDVRPGDVVRITPTDTGVPDQTTVSGVYVGRPAQTAPGTVEVKGTAADTSGGRLPLDQLEARMIAGSEFRLNGRKQLLAPGDGTLSYDAAGSPAFTARFTGLLDADVTRALGGEMVVNWLGRAPLAATELTIFENGPGAEGGPAAGTTCTAPLDATAPRASLSPATRLAFADQGALPPTTSAMRPVVFSNAGSSPVTLRGVYVAGAHPADFTVRGFGGATAVAPGGSVTVDVAFSPKAVGPRSATLNFTSDAANTAYQTVELTGSGTDSAAPTAPTGLRRALVADAPVPGPTVPVQVSWNASTGTVTAYELQRSVAGAAYSTVSSGAATSVTDQAPTSSAVRYQVRACNGTNCSAWVALGASTVVPFQENAKDISRKGTWTRSALAGSNGGSVSTNAGIAGNAAVLKTTGTGFQLIATRGPDRGNAEVWVDGTRRATINLYAAALSPARAVFTLEGLANATHQVELRALGTRTSPSTANRVDVDAFLAVR